MLIKILLFRKCHYNKSLNLKDEMLRLSQYLTTFDHAPQTHGGQIAKFKEGNNRPSYVNLKPLVHTDNKARNKYHTQNKCV